MRLFLLAACVLMIPGCSPDMRELATAPATAKPTKKASPTSTPTAVLGWPANGSGKPTEAVATKPCPGLDPAVYDALARPTEVPERGKPVDGKVWIEKLETQVEDLRVQLGKAVDSAACLATARDRPTPALAPKAQ